MPPLLSRPLRSPTRTPHRRFVEPLPSRPGGLYAGEPEACRRDPVQFLPILGHLALLVVVFRLFRLEGRGFQAVALVVLAALPVHYALPYRWKQPLLVAAAVAALGLVFGPAAAAWATGLVALLLAVALAPVAWPARAVVLATLTAVAAAARVGWINLGVPEIVWPIAASMAMFRILVLMYELKHAEGPERPIDALAYLFLPPNACFLHFPVVDYRTLRRGYLSSDIHAVQREGLAMMVRGCVHLLLVRLVDQRLRIGPAEVDGPATLALYLVTTYLMYLRVSGQFHMACGMLHLFGYRLPETHHRYLLATGFTDYWRRINIYWKDFMVRVFFHPAMFRMRRWPQPVALGVATSLVFAVTWFLHGYQKFWLRGRWGFSGPDALFWGILGALVVVNVWNDARPGRSRARRGRAAAVTPRAFAIRAAKTLGTFTTIALLWALWSSPSVAAFLDVLRRGLAGATTP
jgi:hypothetical protein